MSLISMTHTQEAAAGKAGELWNLACPALLPNILRIPVCMQAATPT